MSAAVLPPAFWPILLGITGAVFGSFIATLAIRWPQGRSVTRGRSMCDACGTVIRARDLIPIVGFVLRRGRCAACDARIAPSHVVVELLGLGIGVVAGLVAPGVAGVAGAVFGWLLLALGAIDLAAFWLPDRLTGTLAAAGLASALAGVPPAPDARLWGGAAGFGSLWLVAFAYRRVRGRTGLGGGDPKLFGAIGLWLGWAALPGVLLAACVAGLAVVLAARIAGRAMTADTRLPLGTLLAGAAFAIWAFTAG